MGAILGAGSAGISAGLGRVTQAASTYSNDWRQRDVTARVDAELEKSAKAAMRAGADGTHDPMNPPKGLHFDPFDLVGALGYRERPSQITFSALDSIATTVPPIADIIKTRVNQVCTFCQLPENRHATGYKVRLRGTDEKKGMSRAAQKRAEELARLLSNTGITPDGNPSDGTPLVDFAKMFIRDSLSFDQAVFEKIRTKKGRPHSIEILDPTTIKLLDPAIRSPGDAFAVQVIQGSIYTDFTRSELAFCVRNPRSGMRTYGYGQSEIETLVREVTSLLWGIDYNRKFFSQGSTTKGILNFKGTIPERHLMAFRRQWNAMVSGINNAWRTPIVNAEDLQWINLQMSNKDMEFEAWINFLIKVSCARFSIAPEEVNFSFGNSGQSQAMGQAPVEEKLQASHDLGLRPLVLWFFYQLNAHFLQEEDPDFEAVPVGLDSKGAEAEIDLLTKQQSAYLTVDEARSVVDLPPLGDKNGGDCILNPTWLQWTQAKQMGGDPGGPDGGPDGGPPGDDGSGEGPPHDGGFDVEDDQGGGPGGPSQDGDDFDIADEPGSVVKSIQQAPSVAAVRYEFRL